MFKPASQAHTDSLIARAERYQSRGEDLPVDLYAALMERGIDASQFNEPTQTESEITND